MATNEPKKRSIVATLVANMLTEREDDFTANVTYVANRSIEDLCNIAASGKSKFSASELLAAHNDLKATAKVPLSGRRLNSIRQKITSPSAALPLRKLKRI